MIVLPEPAGGSQPARANTSDQVRRHNLSTVLTLVHRNREMSRSLLTRETGLNRSTIAGLVSELVERRLVVETEPDSRNRIGRPSPIVSAAGAAVSIAVNPEIDAIAIGLVALGGRVITRIRYPTEHIPTAREAANLAALIIDGMRSELETLYLPVGIGVAVPGLVRAIDGVVRLAPHLGWTEEPLTEMLEAATGLPVVAANDATLGCRAESVFGAGRGVDDLVYLNGGASGIGGGVYMGGTSLAGAAGYAGELGHTLVNSSGSMCHCGASGCLETEVRRDRLLVMLGLADADPAEFERALLESDSLVVRAEVIRQLDFLAVALRNAVNIFNPRLVILGGFLSSLDAAEPGRLEASVIRESLAASREGVRVVRAQLGFDLLMIGAAELAFERMLADPAGFADA